MKNEEAFLRLDWCAAGATDIALDARCAKCGSPNLLPDKQSGPAVDAKFRCEQCGHEHTYRQMMMAGVENDDSFHLCPACGERGFKFDDKVCYLDGETDPCLDENGDPLSEEDFDTYAETGSSPMMLDFEEALAKAK